MAQRTSGTTSGARRKSSAKRTTGRASTRGSASTPRTDKSVQAYREALDRSLTLSRERLQEVFDDAVKRGRMTRADANELISDLVSRGRKASDDLIRDLEKLLEQARREMETRVAPARRRAAAAAGKAARSARDLGDRPLAEADRLRRRAGAPGAPISAYDQLTAAQVKARLGDLSKADLRKVRTQENRGKARKGILADIDRRLE
jgi:polyhydroxyalkanoate synthesis regulator phasin